MACSCSSLQPYDVVQGCCMDIVVVHQAELFHCAACCSHEVTYEDPKNCSPLMLKMLTFAGNTFLEPFLDSIPANATTDTVNSLGSDYTLNLTQLLPDNTAEYIQAP